MISVDVKHLLIPFQENHISRDSGGCARDGGSHDASHDLVAAIAA